MSRIRKQVKGLKGFTLLEMIIVIAIISVLLMIIVPNMTDYIRTSRIREANNQAQQVYDATQDYLTSLQTRGKQVTDYFGTADATSKVCKLGILVTATNRNNISATDIKIGGGSKAEEAAKGILANLSEDFTGMMYVEVYPVTYTVKVALSRSQDDGNDYTAVYTIENGSHFYKSMFQDGTDTDHTADDGYADSQEQCYNGGYLTAYTGQYPIPAPTSTSTSSP